MDIDDEYIEEGYCVPEDEERCCVQDSDAWIAAFVAGTLPQDKLEERSTLILEGTVESTKLVDHKSDGRFTTVNYRSTIRITKVIKGDRKPDDVVTVAWHTRYWVGEGRQPPGHYVFPTLPPCQVVKAYLQGGPDEYQFTHFNGKRTIKRVDTCCYIPGRPYLIEVALFRDDIRVFLDGELLIQASDPTFDSGRFGFTCAGHIGIAFDGLIVYDNRRGVANRTGPGTGARNGR